MANGQIRNWLPSLFLYHLKKQKIKRKISKFGERADLRKDFFS